MDFGQSVLEKALRCGGPIAGTQRRLWKVLRTTQLSHP
jgi:hypothetical protein